MRVITRMLLHAVDVHVPYTQIQEDACNYTHVVTRSGRDVACKITRIRPTETH